MTNRNVLSVQTTRVEDLLGLKTRTAIKGFANGELDPFLLMAHHGPQMFPRANSGLPFSDHPHRGFATVTFVFKGALVHSDSGGHRQTIFDGGVQWMNAGSGIVHNEQVPPAFLKDGGMLEIVQLWVNVPARLKMTPPDYVGVQANAIPDVALDDDAGTLHLVSGDWKGQRGPVQPATDVLLSWIDLARGRRTTLAVPAGRTILFYVLQGALEIGGHEVATGELVRFGRDGDAIGVRAKADTVVLFGHAEPIGEPVAWQGPFVMNTDAELAQAARDLQSGGFRTGAATREVGSVFPG